MIDISTLRPHQCVRLRPYVNPGLAGAKFEAHKKLHGKDFVTEPRYVFLFITSKGKECFESIDLNTLKNRSFKKGSSCIIEYDPTKATAIRDFWGYDELTFLSPDEVEEIIARRTKVLEEAKNKATQEHLDYDQRMYVILHHAKAVTVPA